MNTSNLIKIALKSLHKNTFRTILTMLGIIIGVASVIAMLAIGQGSKQSIEDSISSLGANVIMVLPGGSARGGVSFGAGTTNVFDMKDIEAIQVNSSVTQYVTPVVQTKAQLIASSNNWSTTVTGVYPAYLNIKDWNLTSGSFFTEEAARQGQKVCLLGQTVVENLFGEFTDPVGQSIRINKVPFKVIGVLEEKGAGMFGNNQDDVIIAPFTAVQRRLMGSTDIQQIFISAASEDQIDRATDEIDDILRTKRRLVDEEEAPYDIRTQSEIADVFGSTSSILMILLGSIAGISLIVGGIGIMNIMYVSVTERTKEIGLRLAVGAKGKDILRQFLMEAIIISLLGGLTGILLGVTIAVGFGSFMSWPVSITSLSIIMAFGFSTLIGVFLWMVPCKKSRRLGTN